MLTTNINSFIKMTLLILLVVGCAYKEKIKANDKSSLFFNKTNNISFVEQCGLDKQSEAVKNTFIILKKISYENDCEAVFLKINDLLTLDFGVPKPGEENTIDLSPLIKLEHLRRLNIQFRSLSDPKQLSQLVNLEHLVLNHVNFENTDVLATLNKISFLDLAHNKIKNLDGLQNLTKLTDLWLRDNQIQDVSILKKLESLQYLDLSKNKINDISSIVTLKKLKWIFLEANSLQDLSPIYLLSSLESISFDEKKIPNVPDSIKAKILSLTTTH